VNLETLLFLKKSKVKCHSKGSWGGVKTKLCLILRSFCIFHEELFAQATGAQNTNRAICAPKKVARFLIIQNATALIR
jgi:hypothetical protein